MTPQRQEIEFSELIVRNNTTINSICLRFCGDNAFYFDELRQECVLALWEEFRRHGLGRFRGESSEATWIRQISYHAAVSYLRNPKHQDFCTIGDTYNTKSPDPEEGHDDWRLLDELREHLSGSECVMLDHYLDGTPYSTIASTENITEPTARKRMSRLLKKLKKITRK